MNIQFVNYFLLFFTDIHSITSLFIVYLNSSVMTNLRLSLGLDTGKTVLFRSQYK